MPTLTNPNPATHPTADPTLDELFHRLERAGVVLVARQRSSWQPWMDDFLAALRQNGNVRLASEEVDVSRRTIYNHRATCKEFRVRWREALQAAKKEKVRNQRELSE